MAQLLEVRNARLDAENACLKAEHRLVQLTLRESEVMQAVAAKHGLGQDTSWRLEGRTLYPVK